MSQAGPPADSALQAVLDSVFAGPAYDWVEAEPPLGWLSRAWTALVDWLERLRESQPLLFQLLVWTLVAVLAAILLHAVWVMVRTMRGAVETAPAPKGAPPAPARDAEWYRREADRLAAEGRYADAMHAGFEALARELDRRGALRYDPSRTPRELARDARLDAGGRERLAALVGALYRTAFGRRPFGPGEWQAWRAGLLEGWHVAPG